MNQPELLRAGHLTLQKLDKEFLWKLLEWRNQDAVREFMIDKQPISAERHEKWFHEIVRSNREWVYIINYKNSAIGQINCRFLNTANARGTFVPSSVEIGMYIANQSFRNNLVCFFPCLLLINFCLKEFEGIEVVAKVLESNLNALRFNTELGYVKTQVIESIVYLKLDRELFMQCKSKFEYLFRVSL